MRHHYLVFILFAVIGIYFLFLFGDLGSVLCVPSFGRPIVHPSRPTAILSYKGMEAALHCIKFTV